MLPPVPVGKLGPGQTGVVVAHYATDDHHCAFVVVDAAALATPEGKGVISRAIAINRAINDRHRRGAAARIIVNVASSIGGIIETESAAANSHCSVAFETLVINSSTIAGLSGAVLNGTVGCARTTGTYWPKSYTSTTATPVVLFTPRTIAV